ncbi:NERD domain-containing protein [Flexibacterium corallicola]|uniref:NERD domain-containing protein n=1 Tax=Flexibacterium corallicola TaxID=3037259 RepID=UPI00286EFE7A|nr:NERD domain-containing protein [Pseudovibrio sp. M1P-2-3]
MARIYPRKLSVDVLKDPKRSAEVDVYERLRDQLPDSFYCYYSRSWHEADRNSTQEFDGEADFIVAHVELGLLFLEVKGGRVSCRESDGTWISRDRYDIPFKIKNPIEQAKRSKHHFLRRLRQTRQLRYRRITARHAAVLPNSARPNRALGPDAPLELFAFGDDIERLGDWVRSRMNENGATDDALGLDGIQVLEDMLSSHFELRSHIGVSLADDNRKIEALTAEQAWILDSLEDNSQQAISGGAGTGKTVLAVEKSIRSALSGHRTLLVCYNTPLAAHLNALTKRQENLTACGFHALCINLARQAGLSVPSTLEVADYETTLPELLLEAMETQPSFRFDTIVIDEGQDFYDTWLDTLKLCLKDVDQNEFYVFHDDNQTLYEANGSFIAALPTARYRLTRNLRNTKSIHSVMRKWYNGRATHAAGPEGQPVQWLEIRHRDLAIPTTNERIAFLIKSGQLDPSQIAVLTGSSIDPSAIPRRIGGAPVCNATDVRPGCVIFDTVRRFKGLSRPCVFVIQPELLNTAELRYVALSRANLLLNIVGTSTDLQDLASG